MRHRLPWVMGVVLQLGMLAQLLPVEGRAAPRLEVAPVSIEFGQHTIHTQSEPRQVRLRNAGDAPLDIRKVRLEGDAFRVQGSCSNRSLRPGESCVLDLRFAPSVVEASKGRLVIASSAGEERGVALSGKGAPFVARKGDAPAEPTVASSPPPAIAKPRTGSPPLKLDVEAAAPARTAQPQTRSLSPPDAPTTTAIAAFPWPPPAAVG